MWTAWYLWASFLLVVLISSQSTEYGQFGYDNLRRLLPGAQAVGNFVASVGNAVGLDFSSVDRYFDELWVGPRGSTPFGTAVTIVGCWAFVTWLFVSLGSFLFRGISGGTSIPSVSGGDVVVQRVMAIVVVVFLCVLFAPGWPIEGPVFRVLNDRSIDPIRERESAAIQDELDREVQDWAPADLSPACQLVMTEGPNQLEARSDPSLLRTCGESVKSALEADATMGREPDPRVESSAIRFLLEISSLAQNGQLTDVATDDLQFRRFDRFARTGYPNLRQEGWRQSAQRYLGLLQFPDDRSNSADARAEVGYKLAVLAELLYNGSEAASRDMAYRIATVTEQELHCVPDAVRGSTNAAGTPVATPDLPSCLNLAGHTGTEEGGLLNLGDTGTKVVVSALLLLGVVIPFVPWPDKFPFLLLYIPIGIFMAMAAL
ncbi:MAG: hypothetical protein R2855_05975 [Thermomicrobiales bacterium]